MQLLNILKNNEKHILFYFVLIAITLRIIYVYASYSKSGTSDWVDEFEYIYYGEQIVQGNWDPKFDVGNHMVVGPVIPLLVALFIILFNDPIIPFFGYNIIMTSLMVPVLYYLGKELFSEKTGLAIAIWGIFFAEAFRYSASVLKEPTLFLFIPLTLLFLVRSVKNIFPVKNIIFASLSFTWLIHTDERFFIYFPFFILFILFARLYRTTQFFKLVGTWIIIVFLLMLPWGIRNFITFSQVVILTPRTTAITCRFWGQNIAETASHFSDEGAKQKLITSRLEKAIRFGDQYGITPHEYGMNEARLRAFINFWQPTYFRPAFIQYGFRPQKWSLAHNISGLFFYGIFLPFYLVGFALLIKKKYFVALLIAFIPIIHSLVHAYMVWPLERYRSPVSFIHVMVGFFIFFELFGKIKNHHFDLGK